MVIITPLSESNKTVPEAGCVETRESGKDRYAEFHHGDGTHDIICNTNLSAIFQISEEEEEEQNVDPEVFIKQKILESKHRKLNRKAERKDKGYELMGTFTGVVVLMDGEQQPGPKSILKQFSSFFNRACEYHRHRRVGFDFHREGPVMSPLCDDPCRVNFMDAEVVKRFLTYLFSRCIALHVSFSHDIWVLAEYLQQQGLKHVVSGHLQNNLNHENWLQTFLCSLRISFQTMEQS